MTAPVENTGHPAPRLYVDIASAVPVYEQIRAQITGMIATGHLRAGDKLPAVRQLAADLGIANGTVQRAYNQLDQAGLIQGRGRRGTAVRPQRQHNTDQQQALATSADQLVRAGRDLGLDQDTLLAVVRNAVAHAEGWTA